MARRRRNDINYANAGIGILVIIYILYRFFKSLTPEQSKTLYITLGIIGLISISIIIIKFVVEYLKEKKRKEEEKQRKRIEAIRAEVKKQEEEERKRLAAIEAEKERKRAIERERQRLEKEYQHGYRDDMTGYEYERYCTDLFKYFNWNAETTKQSGDYGGDIIAKKNGIKIVAQCKKWNNSVGLAAVQEVGFAQKYYKADYAIVITNNKFSKAAKEGAKKNDVILLRHPELENWLKTIVPENKQTNITQNTESIKSQKKQYAPKIEKEIVLYLYNSNIKLEDWINKYKDKLEPYIEYFKITEGDDFDLYKASYDAWKELNEPDIKADEWMNILIDSIKITFKELEEKYGPVKDFTDEIINQIIEDQKKENNSLNMN